MELYMQLSKLHSEQKCNWVVFGPDPDQEEKEPAMVILGLPSDEELQNMAVVKTWFADMSAKLQHVKQRI